MTSKTTTRRQITYSPTVNPFAEIAVTGRTIETVKRTIKFGLQGKTLMDPDTGEIAATSVIHAVAELDDHQFVKIFTDGLIAAHALEKAGQRVLYVLLDEYERTPMTRGYADQIAISWLNDGINGRPLAMSRKTFQRGLNELIQNNFIAPAQPGLYWVNAAYFFKGKRVKFINEYVRRTRQTAEHPARQHEPPAQLRNEQRAEAPADAPPVTESP